MSYIGKVHRKDVETGVTVKSKIVSPDKVKATSKNYKITVKANAKSVYDEVVEDVISTLNNIKALLNNDLDNVTSDLTELKGYTRGANGSTIAISIVDDLTEENSELKYSSLRSAVNPQSFIVTRPAIGSKNARGSLKVTGSKYDEVYNKTETWADEVIITVPAMSSAAFFAAYITPQYIWDNVIIKTPGNAASNSGLKSYDNAGYDFVDKNLNLPTTIPSAANVSPETRYGELSNSLSSDLHVQWTITDTLAETIEQISGRLVVDGQVGSINNAKRLSYQNMNTVYNTYASDNHLGIAPYNDNNVTTSLCFTIPGISLTGTFYFGQLSGGNSKTVTFNLKTISKYLTNAEVIAFIQGSNDFKVDCLYNDDDTAVGSSVFGNSAASAFTIDRDAHLKVIRSQDSGIFSSDEKKLCGRIIPAFLISYKIYDGVAGDNTQDTVANYSSTVFGMSNINEVFTISASNAGIMNCQVLKAGLPSGSPLAIKVEAEITCSSYSSDGNSPASTGAQATGGTTRVYSLINLSAQASA